MIPDHDLQRACAICAHILDVFSDYDATGNRIPESIRWDHVYPDQPTDHIAVPVHPDQVHTQGRCDFCFTTGPKWGVPAADFRYDPDTNSAFTRTLGTGSSGSLGAWAACDTCAGHILTNQWGALLRHVLGGYYQRHELTPDTAETEAVRAALVRLWRTLRKNITGPPYLLDQDRQQ